MYRVHSNVSVVSTFIACYLFIDCPRTSLRHVCSDLGKSPIQSQHFILVCLFVLRQPSDPHTYSVVDMALNLVFLSAFQYWHQRQKLPPSASILYLFCNIFTQYFIHGVSYFMHYFYFSGLRCLDRQILLLHSLKVCDLGQAVQIVGLGAAASILEPRCAAGCTVCSRLHGVHTVTTRWSEGVSVISNTWLYFWWNQTWSP